MRFSGQKLLTCVLLALYGSVGLLGYGLHELAGHDHHHHRHVADAGHHHCDGPCSAHEHQHRSSAPTGDWVGPAHDCPVCEFLDQNRGERPTLVAEFSWERVAAAVDCVPPRFCAEPILGLHVPRGPPALNG